MSHLFGGPTAKPAQALPMPDPNDPAVKDAAKRAAALAQQRSGRASTVLTTPATRAAAPDTAYTATKLGTGSIA